MPRRYDKANVTLALSVRNDRSLERKLTSHWMQKSSSFLGSDPSKVSGSRTLVFSSEGRRTDLASKAMAAARFGGFSSSSELRGSEGSSSSGGSPSPPGLPPGASWGSSSGGS